MSTELRAIGLTPRPTCDAWLCGDLAYAPTHSPTGTRQWWVLTGGPGGWTILRCGDVTNVRPSVHADAYFRGIPGKATIAKWATLHAPIVVGQP